MNYADLPLHAGSAPRWLFERMVKLGREISKAVILEYGEKKFLERLNDPYWFQSLGCVIGFDWHSSGLTTTMLGALKTAFQEEELGVKVVGGKGSRQWNTALEIAKQGREFGLSGKKISELKLASKIAGKVDNALVQDSYELYHHCLVFSETGKWIVIQQGMNLENKYARRYHWHGGEELIQEPHAAICCDATQQALNLTSKESKENRKACLDLVKEKVEKVKRDLKLLEEKQSTLFNWNKKDNVKKIDGFRMPQYVNWNALEKAYELQVKDFEELVQVNGIGAKTIRALSLISELVYGEKADWKDPCRYAFAHGGKDGVPRFVNKTEYDKTIEFMQGVVEQANLKNFEKMNALKRLKRVTQSV